MTPNECHRPTGRERGVFSLVEVLLATLILALAATATAYWVETVNGLGADADEQTLGLSIVKVVESIIAPLSFREPGSTNFGPEPGESLGSFDDIDDFSAWLASPPIDATRQPQNGLSDWTVQVTVEIVDPETLAVVSNSDLRRVRVTATRKARVVAEVWWLRARSPFE